MLKYFFIITIAFALLKSTQTFAQSCVDDYFNIKVNTSTVQETTGSAQTSTNDVVMSGNVFRYRSLLKEGWLTKFSSKGTVLWTRHYKTNRYNYTVFNNVTPLENDQLLVTGNVGDVDTMSWPVTHFTQYAFVMKTDKYGTPIWTKIIGKLYLGIKEPLSDISSVKVTKEGDFILSLGYWQDQNYNVILKMNKDGQVKWATTILSNLNASSMGTPKLVELKNGSIAFANSLSYIDPTSFASNDGYYLGFLDGSGGKVLGERFYHSIDTLSAQKKILGQICNIVELANGNISFITSYADSKYITFRETKQILNYYTDSLGNLKKILSYVKSKPPFYASSAVTSSGDNRVVLMDNGDSIMMMEILPDGVIKWINDYGKIGRSQETRSLLKTESGYYFFSLLHDGGSKLMNMVKTDKTGYIECGSSPYQITTQDFTSAFTTKYSHLTFEQKYLTFDDYPALYSDDYSMTSTDGCRKTCCFDVTDSVATVNLCDKPYYTLPNSDTVNRSGMYSVVYKASSGCDSIVYYPVVLSYTPIVSLGFDRCMGQKDTIILKVQDGYHYYNWNNIITTENTFSVKEPGTYNVSVNNFCGTKRDTINVYKDCEFEIIMPNAFTPNRDYNNDIFRIPPQITNQLVSFTVFNRWGQIVFRTSNISEGWDGNVNGYPAPTGTYVYHIVMKSLDRIHNVTKRGYVVLLR